MSHHGSKPIDEMPEGIRRLINEMKNTAGFRGAIGSFPAGKLTKCDEGAIQFAVGEKDGKVVLDFGSPVSWIGMSPQEAADLASVLLRRAREAARSVGLSVHINLGV